LGSSAGLLKTTHAVGAGRDGHITDAKFRKKVPANFVAKSLHPLSAKAVENIYGKLIFSLPWLWKTFMAS
jgi:hypothetical protein